MHCSKILFWADLNKYFMIFQLYISVSHCVLLLLPSLKAVVCKLVFHYLYSPILNLPVFDTTLGLAVGKLKRTGNSLAVSYISLLLSMASLHKGSKWACRHHFWMGYCLLALYTFICGTQKLYSLLTLYFSSGLKLFATNSACRMNYIYNIPCFVCSNTVWSFC